MNVSQSVRTLPGRRPKKTVSPPGEPMVNPQLLSSLRSQRITLNDKSIDVLKLRGCEAKKLQEIGIINLEQLANSNERALRTIPHFGIMKVRRLKSRLNTYLSSLAPAGIQPEEDDSSFLEIQADACIAVEDDPQLSAADDIILELEATSKTLEKLKQRLRQ